MAIGSYYIVREGWSCNLCGHMTWTKKTKHRCNNAPHFMSAEVVRGIPKHKIKKVMALLKAKS